MSPFVQTDLYLEVKPMLELTLKADELGLQLLVSRAEGPPVDGVEVPLEVGLPAEVLLGPELHARVGRVGAGPVELLIIHRVQVLDEGGGLGLRDILDEGARVAEPNSCLTIHDNHQRLELSGVEESVLHESNDIVRGGSILVLEGADQL